MQGWSFKGQSTASGDRSSKQFKPNEDTYSSPKQKLHQLYHEGAASSTGGGGGGQRNPVRRKLERYPSYLPDRTPVLPQRVINLRLEHSQQQHLSSYIMEKSQPFTTAQYDNDQDDADQELYLARGSLFSTTKEKIGMQRALIEENKVLGPSSSPLGG